MIQEAGTRWDCWLKFCRSWTRSYSCSIACNIAGNNSRCGHTVQLACCVQLHAMLHRVSHPLHAIRQKLNENISPTCFNSFVFSSIAPLPARSPLNSIRPQTRKAESPESDAACQSQNCVDCFLPLVPSPSSAQSAPTILAFQYGGQPMRHVVTLLFCFYYPRRSAILNCS